MGYGLSQTAIYRLSDRTQWVLAGSLTAVVWVGLLAFLARLLSTDDTTDDTIDDITDDIS